MAAVLYKRNLEPNEVTPGPEKFLSYVGLAEYYASPPPNTELQEATKARWENVIHNSDLALQQRIYEKEALGSELDNERCTMVYWLKAMAQHELAKHEPSQDQFALQTCMMAMAPGQLEYTTSNTKYLDILTLMITIHATKKKKMKKGHFAILSLIRNCPSNVRAEWLWHCFEKDPLRRAAVMTRRIDFLIQVYEEAIAYHAKQNEWFGVLFLTTELSYIYRRDAQVTGMAEIALEKLIIEAKNNMTKLNAPPMYVVYYYVFPYLVDLLYEKYHVAKSQKEKENEMTKLKQLVEDLGSTSFIEQGFLAGSLLTLAKMLRGCGRIEDARTQAKRAFNICMEDLQDTFTYNDSSAFRLLGKILMFVELESDAQIALSLQFSEVDKTHEDSQNEPVETSPTTNNATAFVAVNGNDSNLQNTAGELSKAQSDKNSIESEPIGKNDDAQEPQQQQDPNGIGPETTEGSKEGVEKSQRNISNEKTINPWSEDLIPETSRRIVCNGPCGKGFENYWDGTNIYFCTDCYEVDFCSECHAQQVRYHTKMGDGFWYKCCWAEHKYIKQPVEGWRGVQNGVIRIGCKQKPFKLWLQAVKEKWIVKLAAIAE
jgi:hypothetical protein